MRLCLCTKIFEMAWRPQKLLDLYEIWHTCSLGEYLRDVFLVFDVFYFSARETGFKSKKWPNFTFNLQDRLEATENVRLS